MAVMGARWRREKCEINEIRHLDDRREAGGMAATCRVEFMIRDP